MVIPTRELAVRVFGREGDLLADTATQALIVASSILVTGGILISPMIADLATVFAVSEARGGWLIVSYTAAAAICLPIVGALSDRLGRKPVMTAGLVLFGIAGAAVGVVSTFETALFMRALQGIGFACATPVILTLIGDLYSGTRETTVQGMRVSANSLMNAVAPLIGGLLFVYSWRTPFLLYFLTLPVALWVWQSVPEIQPQNDWSYREYFDNTLVALQQKAMVLLMISFALRFVLFYGLITYISVLAKQEAAMTVVAVGVLMSVRGIAKTAMSTQVGRLSVDYDTVLLTCVSFFFLSLGIVIMGAMPNVLMLTFGITVVGIADGVLSPAQKSIVNKFSSTGTRGGVMSTAVTMQNIGQVIGPIIFSVMMGFVGVSQTFLTLGASVGALGVVSVAGILYLGNPLDSKLS
ncbi:MFS transporter [Halobellus captivus]|uniref:MFS transporter n=1 Tax=Halobellus captivus TaxID=2592614 RepID=UPI001396878D|nr:MFS transporter [Halobellus captivus]